MSERLKPGPKSNKDSRIRDICSTVDKLKSPTLLDILMVMTHLTYDTCRVHSKLAIQAGLLEKEGGSFPFRYKTSSAWSNLSASDKVCLPPVVRRKQSVITLKDKVHPLDVVWLNMHGISHDFHNLDTKDSK